MSVTFNPDIKNIFRNFKSNMSWRLDLTKYEDVKINADKIYNLIETKQMPPPSYNPLSDDEIKMFKQWMDDGYPE